MLDEDLLQIRQLAVEDGAFRLWFFANTMAASWFENIQTLKIVMEYEMY